MSNLRFSVVIVCIVLGVAALSAALVSFSERGRYAFHFNDGSPVPFILDTKTGRVWVNHHLMDVPEDKPGQTP